MGMLQNEYFHYHFCWNYFAKEIYRYNIYQQNYQMGAILVKKKTKGRTRITLGEEMILCFKQIEFGIIKRINAYLHRVYPSITTFGI